MLAINDKMFTFAALKTFFYTSGSSSVGRARPCQGRGREFESRLPLKDPGLTPDRDFFLIGFGCKEEAKLRSHTHSHSIANRARNRARTRRGYIKDLFATLIEGISIEIFFNRLWV